MFPNRSSLLLLAALGALACPPAWAAPKDSARCSQVPLIHAAWKVLPPELSFPCDPAHLVVIRDFESFLADHPDLAANALLRERARHAFAFTITPAWPIYVNLGPHQASADAFNRSQPWVAFAIAAVLAHERVHATGNLSEAAGLLAEFQLDQRFQSQRNLPPAFDLHQLEQQYRAALAQETTRPAEPPKP